MKLVTEYLTAGEAELAASNLEAAGIANFVSNSDSARLPIATSYAGGVGDLGINGALGLLFQLLGATILLAIVVFAVTRL